MKNIRQKFVGSLKIKIPTRTVPTAPIPVHTAYAVPIGNVCDALNNKNILIARHTKKPSSHNIVVAPVLSLALPKQVAKPISKNPPITSNTQFILTVLRLIPKELHSATCFLNLRVLSSSRD